MNYIRPVYARFYDIMTDSWTWKRFDGDALPRHIELGYTPVFAGADVPQAVREGCDAAPDGKFVELVGGRHSTGAPIGDHRSGYVVVTDSGAIMQALRAP